MRGELRVDRLDLLLQARQVLLRRGHVVARVVADVEPVPMQLGDLLQAMSGLVGAERESSAG